MTTETAAVSTETAVTVAQTTAMATNQEPYDDGFGELEPEDMIIPWLIIAQPQVKGIPEQHVGKLHINVTGDFREEMIVSPVKMKKTRILFPKDYDPDNVPLCRSHDFKVPANDIPGATPMCDTCGLLPLEPGEKKAKHKCEYANWTVNDKGKSVPPRCQETWNYLLIDLEKFIPMFSAFKSTALKPIRKITSSMKLVCQAKKLSMWNMKFKITTQKDPGAGNFYIPVFTDMLELEGEERLIMEQIRMSLASVEMRATDEQDVTTAPPAAEPEEVEF